jgi:hypothetical protein
MYWTVQDQPERTVIWNRRKSLYFSLSYREEKICHWLSQTNISVRCLARNQSPVNNHVYYLVSICKLTTRCYSSWHYHTDVVYMMLFQVEDWVENSVTIKPLYSILPLSYILTIDDNKCFIVELMMLYVK